MKWELQGTKIEVGASTNTLSAIQGTAIEAGDHRHTLEAGASRSIPLFGIRYVFPLPYIPILLITTDPYTVNFIYTLNLTTR